MKKYAVSLVLFLTFVPSSAARVQPSQFSQFRVHHSRLSHKTIATLTSKPIRESWSRHDRRAGEFGRNQPAVVSTGTDNGAPTHNVSLTLVVQ
jgi:hypothetical protein